MRKNRAAHSPFWLAPWVGFLLVAACSQRAGEQPGVSQVTLTGAEEGRQATVAPSQIVTVRLPSKPSTGFIWEVAQLDTSVLKPLDQYHEFPGEAGGEATQVHRFVPVSKGSTKLELAYHRP